MTTPAFPVEGGCRCGRVRFRLSGTPLMELACHCRGCQRMSASAFSTTLMMAADDFAVIQGHTEIGGIHGDQGRHHHCGWCKGWVYTDAVAHPDIRNVRATLLDDPNWFAPWAETQTAERLAWAHTGAERSFERFPGSDEIPALLKAYREARPSSAERGPVAAAAPRADPRVAAPAPAANGGSSVAGEVIAQALGLPVLRIDLSRVVDKYIGETEKNLNRLFDEAESSGAILVFDEADALFGKRSHVTEARDRSAQAVSRLLVDRLARFDGTVVWSARPRNDVDPS